MLPPSFLALRQLFPDSIITYHKLLESTQVFHAAAAVEALLSVHYRHSSAFLKKRAWERYYA